MPVITFRVSLADPRSWPELNVILEPVGVPDLKWCHVVSFSAASLAAGLVSGPGFAFDGVVVGENVFLDHLMDLGRNSGEGAGAAAEGGHLQAGYVPGFEASGEVKAVGFEGDYWCGDGRGSHFEGRFVAVGP